MLTERLEDVQQVNSSPKMMWQMKQVQRVAEATESEVMLGVSKQVKFSTRQHTFVFLSYLTRSLHLTCALLSTLVGIELKRKSSVEQ